MRALRRPSVRGFGADTAAAIFLFGVGQSEVWGGWRAGGDGPAFHGSKPIEALVVTLATVPLAWRRRAPLPASAVVSAALAAQVVFVAPDVSFAAGLLPLAVMVYSVAAWGAAGWRLLGLAWLIAAQATLASRITEMRSTGEVLFGTFVTAGMWFVGDLSRSHRRRAVRSDARAGRLEAEREEWRRAAVAEERARMARELHDVIAHSVSVMGVQAGAARTRLETDPERAREALRAIEATARDSVVELRRLLAILRADEAQYALEPQPGMDEVGALVDRLRRAGLPVRLSVEGEARRLPPGVALNAYRIVQEALTNTLKHADGARACVRIAYDVDALVLDISDDGAHADRGNGGRGQGLIGMRERAALYGGTLDAGPRSQGGFAVRARLPIEARTP